MTKRIVCLGDCGVDHYVDLGLVRPGGCSLNVAINLARLGGARCRVEIISAVGTDDAGDAVLACVSREPLGSHIRRMKGATPKQLLELQPGGERRFVGYDAGVLPRFEPDSLQVAMIGEADWTMSVLYAQIELMMQRVLQTPRAGKLAIDFMDMKDFNRSLDRIEWILRQTELAFFGLCAQDGALIEDIRQMTAVRDSTAIVTLGRDGGIAFQRGLPTPFRAHQVDRVIDTTGAGDAFAAAFMSRYADDESLHEALEFAAVHAASVVQQIGAFTVPKR